MMRTLRDKKTMQAILWFVIVCFVIGFIFLAVGSRFQWANSNRDPNMLARIGDTKITYAEFNKECQPVLDKLYGMKDEAPSEEELKKVREQVLDRLVDEAILRQTALRLGLSVPDEELMGWLQHQNYFLDETGKFDKNRYFKVLEANQLTPEQFENDQRLEMLSQKIRSLLSDGVLYSTEDLTHYYDLLSRDLKADYVVLEPSHYEKQITASEAELKNYYDNNKSRYDHPERAKVRHILMALPPSFSAADEAKVKATLEDYRKQLLSKKAKFSELAYKYSVDGGSKDHGGELGWISRDAMGKDMKDFEDMIFHLKKGELSKPFKSKYGYHLVELEDYEKEYKSTYEGVKTKVREQFVKEKAAGKVIAVSEKLIEKLRNHEDIAKAAGELGLSYDTTSWFNWKGKIAGIKDSEEFTHQLSSLYPRDWKGPMVDGDKDYFFQIAEIRAAKTAPEDFEKARSEVSRLLTSERQDAWLKSFLQQQRKKLNVKTYLDS
ncbi:MAG TPA: SurA N-terminal domain-containing protein [bacterium]|nr:SurA N-terminal domain-containing protein [bacterium]